MYEQNNGYNVVRCDICGRAEYFNPLAISAIEDNKTHFQRLDDAWGREGGLTHPKPGVAEPDKVKLHYCNICGPELYPEEYDHEDKWPSLEEWQREQEEENDMMYRAWKESQKAGE